MPPQNSTLKTFVVSSENLADLLEVPSIRFIPMRISKNTPYPAYRAIAIPRTGKERAATPNEISLVCGHEFWQCSSRQIGAETLRKWLKREITDNEAANGPENNEPAE